MASKLPIVKQVAWLSIFPQITLVGIVFGACYYISPEYFHILGFLIYIIIIYLLRALIPSKHRKGVKLVKQKKYAEAIPYFQKSFLFFSKNKWLDKFRFITMISSSRISYTEMALLNEAFCLTQLEKKDEAIEKYEKILESYPDSEMAIAALKMLK